MDTLNRHLPPILLYQETSSYSTVIAQGCSETYMRSWRIRRGTFLMAKLPPQIADERTGSVGVRHAEITRADTNESEGNNALIMPDGAMSGEPVVKKKSLKTNTHFLKLAIRMPSSEQPGPQKGCSSWGTHTQRSIP